MTTVAWMLAVLIAAGFGYAMWRAYGQWQDRQRAAEARMASFVAQAKGPLAQAAAQPAPAAQPDARERLLFDAAAKTAQAGEPVLAIQLYARLLSRYPQSALAAQARAAVAEQKTRLGKG
jgi:TolA-binding protein